jgi:hypothetical protein
MKRLYLSATLILALSACGSASQLKPAQGHSLPVAPYGAETTPNASALLKASPQQRPQRDDELLKQSQKRQPDPFDLPPQ